MEKKEIESDLIGFAVTFEELCVLEEALSNQSHMFTAILKGVPVPAKQKQAIGKALQISLGMQKRALEILAEFEFIEEDNE
jgi:hypothetical protein